MSSYNCATKAIHPSSTFHMEYEGPDQSGNYKPVTVSGPYPYEVTDAINSLIAQDKAAFVTTGRPRGFFGKWNYKPSARPEAREFSEDFMKQEETPNFTRRVHTGEIIMNEALFSSAKLTHHPGEIPAAPPVPGSPIGVLASDLIRVFEINPRHKAWIKLKNGRWLPMGGEYKIGTEKVPSSEFVFADVELPQVYSLLCGFSQDGGLITDAGAMLNEATYDILTEMAELPDTVKMFKDAALLFSKRGKKMRKYIAEIARESGSPSGSVRLADKIASARLLYRYGILPLKYSYDDIKELMKESFKKRYVAGLSKDSSYTVPELEGFQFSGGYSQEHKALFKRRLDPNSSLDQFQAVFGVNLPLTVWEKTPWSLVVDWFINVGDYLTSINPMPSIEERGCYAVKIGATGSFVHLDNGDIIEVEVSHYSRKLINRMSDSSLVWNPNLTRDRLFDGAAFSWQILRKKIKDLKFNKLK